MQEGLSNQMYLHFFFKAVEDLHLFLVNNDSTSCNKMVKIQVAAILKMGLLGTLLHTRDEAFIFKWQDTV